MPSDRSNVLSSRRSVCLSSEADAVVLLMRCRLPYSILYLSQETAVFVASDVYDMGRHNILSEEVYE